MAFPQLFKAVQGPAVQVIASGTTNANGEIIFEGLEPITYSWSATKACLSNSITFGHFPVVGPLTSGVRNSYVTRLSPKGFLTISNNTADIYMIYTSPFQLSGLQVNAHSSQTIPLDEGTHTISYQKQSTTITSDTTVNILCAVPAQINIQ